MPAMMKEVPDMTGSLTNVTYSIINTPWLFSPQIMPLLNSVRHLKQT